LHKLNLDIYMHAEAINETLYEYACTRVHICKQMEVAKLVVEI